MDGFKEKKWFVYMGDHHEGPFSLEEIQGKMQAGLVTASQYAWCEGMGDWQQIPEVEAFQSILKPSLRLVPSVPPTPTERREPTLTDATRMAPVSSGEGTIAVSRTDLHAPAAESVPGTASAVVETATPFVAQVLTEPQPQAMAASEVVTIAAHAPSIETPFAEEELVQKPKRNFRRLLRPLLWIALLASVTAAAVLGVFDPLLSSPAVVGVSRTIGNATRPVMLQLAEKVPLVSRWFSPIPRLDEVSAADWPDFVDAARVPEPGTAPRVGVAVAQPDLLQPSFLVSSPLPDGTVFDIEVEGVPDTLLNHTEFFAKSRATLASRWGRSDAIRTPDGRPVPRGEYWVRVFEAGKGGAGAQPLSRKGYFLGGVRDDTYRDRLKEYHVRLAEKAKAELEELKQFTGSVEQQLQSTQSEFTRYRAAKGKKPVAAAAKTWANFHKKWTQFDAQLSGTVQSWTPEKLQTDTFYSSLYERVKAAALAQSQVHGLHHAWTTGAVSPEFEQELQTAGTNAATAIREVREKIQQAEAIPPSSTGMPRKDGL